MAILAEAVEQALLEEGITRQAVEEALAIGRAQGDIILDEATMELTTHAVLDNLTLWVRYRELGDNIEVLDAYYHRMQVS